MYTQQLGRYCSLLVEVSLARNDPSPMIDIDSGTALGARLPNLISSTTPRDKKTPTAFLYNSEAKEGKGAVDLTMRTIDF